MRDIVILFKYSFDYFVYTDVLNDVFEIFAIPTVYTLTNITSIPSLWMGLHTSFYNINKIGNVTYNRKKRSDYSDGFFHVVILTLLLY